jgi:hypothetical protein
MDLISSGYTPATKYFVTQITSKWNLCNVCELIRVETQTLCESFITYITAQWTVKTMCELMFLQLIPLPE